MTTESVHPYCVTRQRYWHENGAQAVEIAARLDYSGPDAVEIIGEYDDVRDAAEAAIAAADGWGPIVLALNDLVYPVTDDGLTPDECREWAQRRYDALPKCERCGEGFTGSGWGHDLSDGYPFCSEHCADEDYDALLDDENGGAS